MRLMMTVQIPTEAGNAAIEDGSLPQIVGNALEALKAEAAYFTSTDGMRTGLIFFEMADSSDIPRRLSRSSRGSAPRSSCRRS